MRKQLLILGFGGLLASGAVFAAPVNVNSAQSLDMARQLNGVSDVLAARIVAERVENGPFRNSEELVKRVSGFDQRTLNRNRSNIKVSDS